MDNKTILNKVSEIENDAYNLKDVSKVVETIKSMSNSKACLTFPTSQHYRFLFAGLR